MGGFKMKIKNGKLPIASVSLLLLAGTVVLAQDVKYNYDFEVDFSKYKAYKWVQIKGATYPDELTDRQIKAALDAELAKKGFSKTEGEDASLLVAYQVAVQQEKQLNAWGGGWRFGGGTVTTSTINVGQLVFDAYDPATQHLVWQGSATKSIHPSDDPEKNQEHLQKAVHKLLEHFPPEKKD
jgi:hypothetical protein